MKKIIIQTVLASVAVLGMGFFLAHAALYNPGSSTGSGGGAVATTTVNSLSGAVTVQGTAGTSVTTSGQTITISSTVGLAPANNLSDVANSSTARTNLGVWGNNYSDGTFPTTGVAFTANTLKCFGFPITIPVQFTKIVYNVQQTDSSTDRYDWGIYLTSSTTPTQMQLVADLGGIELNVTGTASSSIVQGTASLLPSNSQNYYECLTGNSTTAKYGYVGANIGDYANNTSQSASVSGIVPTTSTVPVQSWSSTALPYVYLYQ